MKKVNQAPSGAEVKKASDFPDLGADAVVTGPKIKKKEKPAPEPEPAAMESAAEAPKVEVSAPEPSPAPESTPEG